MRTRGSRILRCGAARRLLLAAVTAGACGDNDAASKMTQAWEPDSSSSGAEDSSGDPPESTQASSNPTGASCDAPCESPPGDCSLAPGTCEDRACVYPSALAGTPCTGDCSGTGFCDAGGTCVCSESCADTCIGGPNQNAACDDTGACIRSCNAPFEDCDGDPSNGCEVPVGVPHQCSLQGLSASGGCWTAYCGEAQGAGIFNFGTYHCVDCSTCGLTDGGQCHWCNHDDGTWYPAEACECGEYLDAVCTAG